MKHVLKISLVFALMQITFNSCNKKTLNVIDQQTSVEPVSLNKPKVYTYEGKFRSLGAPYFTCDPKPNKVCNIVAVFPHQSINGNVTTYSGTSDQKVIFHTYDQVNEDEFTIRQANTLIATSNADGSTTFQYD